jgi:hypothetical protein
MKKIISKTIIDGLGLAVLVAAMTDANAFSLSTSPVSGVRSADVADAGAGRPTSPPLFSTSSLRELAGAGAGRPTSPPLLSTSSLRELADAGAGRPTSSPTFDGGRSRRTSLRYDRTRSRGTCLRVAAMTGGDHGMLEKWNEIDAFWHDSRISDEIRLTTFKQISNDQISLYKSHKSFMIGIKNMTDVFNGLVRHESIAHQLISLYDLIITINPAKECIFENLSKLSIIDDIRTYEFENIVSQLATLSYDDRIDFNYFFNTFISPKINTHDIDYLIKGISLPAIDSASLIKVCDQNTNMSEFLVLCQHLERASVVMGENFEKYQNLILNIMSQKGTARLSFLNRLFKGAYGPGPSTLAGLQLIAEQFSFMDSNINFVEAEAKIMAALFAKFYNIKNLDIKIFTKEHFRDVCLASVLMECEELSYYGRCDLVFKLAIDSLEYKSASLSQERIAGSLIAFIDKEFERHGIGYGAEVSDDPQTREYQELFVKYSRVR